MLPVPAYVVQRPWLHCWLSQLQHHFWPIQRPEPKTEKGYISLGMSLRMSKRISFFELTNERWVREKFSTNEELHNPTPIPMISFWTSFETSLGICILSALYSCWFLFTLCVRRTWYQYYQIAGLLPAELAGRVKKNHSI